MFLIRINGNIYNVLLSRTSYRESVVGIQVLEYFKHCSNLEGRHILPSIFIIKSTAMKAGERYNNYDLKGNFISSLQMVEEGKLHIYNQEGDKQAYGKVLDNYRFNIYDLDGNLIFHGIRKDGPAYNLYDNDGDQIGYGNPV